ncbi:MAG: SH3 domain-containing protein [Pyrinomonadaceae bacterium]|nr:SH3 domain-containing protein [Pyrinomonadaceae bacterium]MCX7640342.1 SH3 domain-containing protein [Pyrinomonadaceae bacterium]MDW8304769.1 SH3 domain-containing protein [Acidobacteriota bacterium]
MKRFAFFLLFSFVTSTVSAQQKSVALQKRSDKKTKEEAVFVVIDERLAVVRTDASLYATPIQRIRRGRIVTVSATKQDENGIKFYLIQLPNLKGWIQAEALAFTKSKTDDRRLVMLIQGSSGFDKIERVAIFLKHYPNSEFRPAVLLLFGDLLEEAAYNLSRDANRRLDEKEMKASGAPIKSFYLSYSGLDRYRKLGVVFLFNENTRSFHYDGQAWKEIINRYPNTFEATEAKKRLENLELKMQQTK